MIRASGGKFKVYSHKTGKLLGTYPTRAEAEAAIRRHKYYGKKKGK